MFSELLPGLTASMTDLPALLTVTNIAETGTAVQTAPLGAHVAVDQGAIGGSFAFTSLAPITVGGKTFAAGANLLSATFTDADIIGIKGATAASLVDSTANGSVIYSSDFMTFHPGATEDFSWAISSVLPGLGYTSGKAINAFRGNGAGTFAADPPEVIATPEPGAWTIMLLSSAILGARLRRRRFATR